MSTPTAITPVFRFAPSPNGELHLGHAYSAVFTARMAGRLGGLFLVRIEDIDFARCRDTYVTQILEDLAWLGLSWEMPVLRQSQRLDAYRDAAARLRQLGLLYPCFATRGDIAAAVALRPTGLDPDGAPIYPGLHRGLSHPDAERRMASGEPFAWRLDTAKAQVQACEMYDGKPLTFASIGEDGRLTDQLAEPDRWGDAVIVRKEVPASYHLAVVVDDAEQGVTHVTRGDDLRAATGLHRLLQVLLGLPPSVYHHHKLIMDRDGCKLSKSTGATSLRALRAAGLSPEDVLARVGLASG